jgi:hypothetical protein
VQRHAVSVHGHDVEANLGIWSNDLYVIGCEPANRAAFSLIYAGKRLTETIVRTGLYLYENDRIPIAADQVDLAARYA